MENICTAIQHPTTTTTTFSPAIQLLTAFDSVRYHWYHVNTERVYLVIRDPVWDVIYIYIYIQNKNMVFAQISA